MPSEREPGGDQARRLAEALDRVSAALSRLQYGAIQLTVHDGRVQQIDVTEKHRLPS